MVERFIQELIDKSSAKRSSLRAFFTRCDRQSRKPFIRPGFFA